MQAMTITKELRFAMDEKGMKTLAPTLVGQRLSYWDNDRQLKHGLVKYADVARDRYGNPFIEVEMEEETAATGSDHGARVPDTAS
jgi:hypothetical protein